VQVEAGFAQGEAVACLACRQQQMWAGTIELFGMIEVVGQVLAVIGSIAFEDVGEAHVNMPPLACRQQLVKCIGQHRVAEAKTRTIGLHQVRAAADFGQVAQDAGYRQGQRLGEHAALKMRALHGGETEQIALTL